MAVVEHTFVFADLAGFTALTEAHGDAESTELTHQFFGAVRELLGEYEAEEVKTIGDAVMLCVPSAGHAVRLAVRIAHGPGTQHGFPSIRIGMDTGAATERDGDWFGATVNTAARVSGAASGGEILLTEATRLAAGEVEGVQFSERGRQEFKNVSQPVLLHAAVAQGASIAKDLAVDPVCRMAVSPFRAAANMTHSGDEYHFCSLDCARAFAEAPERYVHTDDSGRRSRGYRTAALIQGGSYIGFGLWSLAGRSHYKRIHRIRRDDWVLNAHGAWLLAVGSTLVTAALRDEAHRPELKLLGAGAAIGLAANDGALRRRLPRIYRGDLAYELALAGAWLLPAAKKRGRPDRAALLS